MQLRRHSERGYDLITEVQGEEEVQIAARAGAMVHVFVLYFMPRKKIVFHFT